MLIMNLVLEPLTNNKVSKPSQYIFSETKNKVSKPSQYIFSETNQSFISRKLFEKVYCIGWKLQTYFDSYFEMVEYNCQKKCVFRVQFIIKLTRFAHSPNSIRTCVAACQSDSLRIAPPVTIADRSDTWIQTADCTGLLHYTDGLSQLAMTQ